MAPIFVSITDRSGKKTLAELSISSDVRFFRFVLTSKTVQEEEARLRDAPHDRVARPPFAILALTPRPSSPSPGRHLINNP